jgi:hypothetical protein
MPWVRNEVINRDSPDAGSTAAIVRSWCPRSKGIAAWKGGARPRKLRLGRASVPTGPSRLLTSALRAHLSRADPRC